MHMHSCVGTNLFHHITNTKDTKCESHKDQATETSLTRLSLSSNQFSIHKTCHSQLRDITWLVFTGGSGGSGLLGGAGLSLT